MSVWSFGALWLRETMGEGEVGTGSAGSNGSEELGLPSGAMEKKVPC